MSLSRILCWMLTACFAGVVAGQEKAEPSRPLEYGWKVGEEYGYSMNIEVNDAGTKRALKGTCTYKVLNVGKNIQRSEGSGTGFVISSKGHIATCAHVVEDAKEIKVTLGEKTYDAKVVLRDAATDLAIIKIDATDLTVLPLGDSDGVQLAERVRAFGFPLASVLGTGLKVASGEIAGTVNLPEYGKQIQIDAPINPGNSGGPVINDRGQVVGVASGKIAEGIAKSVGFAVPVNRLKSKIEQLGLEVPGSGAGEKLEGVALAAAARPAIAFVKVKSETGGDVFEVSYNASYTNRVTSTPSGAVRSYSSNSSRQATGKLKITKLGQILSHTGRNANLPYVLGPVCELFINPLDEFGREKWTVESKAALSLVRRDDRFGPSGMFGFGPPGSPFARPRERNVKTMDATEISRFAIRKVEGNRVSIGKNYEFSTTDDAAEPFLKIRGDGELVFDRKLGLPVSFEYTAKLLQHEEFVDQRTPIRMSFQLRSSEEMKKEREARAAKLAESKRRRDAQMAKQKREQEIARTVPSKARVDAAILAVKSGAFGGHRNLEKLAGLAIVPECRNDVLKLATDHLDDSSPFWKSAAAKVIGHWGDKNHLSELRAVAKLNRRMLGDAQSMALKKLVEYGDEECLGLIIARLADLGSRSSAESIIRDTGAKFEQPLQDALPLTSDHFARKSMVCLLGDVGTEKSLKFLEKMATVNPRQMVGSDIRKAIEKIRARVSKAKEKE